MKSIVVILLSICTSFAFAKSEDRLKELVRKDVISKLHSGKGLSASEKKEYDDLSDELGLMVTSQLTSEVMTEIQKQNTPSSLKTEQVAQTQPDLQKMLSPKPVAVAQASQALKSQSSSAPAAPQVQAQPEAAKALPEKKAPATEVKPESAPNITVVINQPGAQPIVTTTTGQSPDAQATGAALSPNQSSLEKKPEAPKPEKDPLTPYINKETEKKMLKAYREAANKSLEEPEFSSKKPSSNHGDQIYTPSPVGGGIARPGFVVQRDSTSIVTYAVSVNDSVTIETCVADGVSINLDESIKTKIQNVIISDDKFFTYKTLENKRGVFVRLMKPVPEGGTWLASLRLYRAEDDKAYLINLVGLPCPTGVIRFPKQVYLTEKVNRNARIDDKYKLGDTEVLTPEDTIIAASYGYDTTDAYGVKVYDMVASAGAKVVSLGVEINGLTEPDDSEFKVLDYHQITQIKTTYRYLELQSKKATNTRGQKVQRFNLTVSVDKDYILTRKYIYLMLINNKKKNYEYVRVDLAEYMRSLKERGFDL